MSKQKKVLFDDSENEEDGELHINKAYANKYQEWRLSEELQKYKDRFGDEDSTSESSSDEDFAEADNPEFDREFLRTMGALHKKTDHKLEGVKFFTGNYSKKKEKEKEEQAMTVKDYERLLITDHGGELDEEEEGPRSKKDLEKLPKNKRMSGFEDGLSSGEDDSGDELFTSGLFKVKESDKSAKEEKTQPEQEDTLAFIRGECSSLRNEDDRGLLESLKEAWNDPKKSTDEKWLIDFFVNERYNEEEDDSKLRPYNGVVIDEESISEDEKTLEAMETFETKYRFRFEEPDEEFIKKYPRIIQDSMRAKDERRKQKRIALKERKQKEKEVKRQEIERLKALKYKEIEAKIDKIKEASGNQDIDLGEKLFEEDFDEEQHDQVMSEMFGEDYYAVDDGNDEKPVFDNDEDIDVIQDYDHWLEKQDANIYDGEETGDWEEEDHGAYSMGDGHNRTEARSLQQEMIEASSKKKGRRKSKFAKAIKQKKPVFDPREKDFESYFDEYYQLDFEDIISGMPCRFKYRKVEPNNFGLSTEEILSAQDKELNKWISLKKILRYQRDEKEESKDKKVYHHRSSQPHVKQKILPSLFVEDPVQHHVSEEEKKRLKNLKKKLRRQQKLLGTMGENPDSTPTVNPVNSDYRHNECDATPQCDDGGHSKKAKKRKYKNSILDAEDNCISIDEAIKQPKKKKKKHTGYESQEDKSSIEINPSGYKEELQPSNTIKEKDKSVMETQNKFNNSGASDTTAARSQKKKKKRNTKSTVDMIQESKNKKKLATRDDSFFLGISDNRLAAYGENPKKIKNKVKYRKQEF
ncbi:protein KRI1 homolog isoform X2 [Portunus trituberculatus]|uniref:protein KRI1 homolog isoform X2 n=1 Tax=Portunus trituberculatus TaxID=210409 RepID=UPI001E1D0BF3|nr:protein KRI1 homolog isoform X2 [Portunus trituberculatus]